MPLLFSLWLLVNLSVQTSLTSWTRSTLQIDTSNAKFTTFVGVDKVNEDIWLLGGMYTGDETVTSDNEVNILHLSSTPNWEAYTQSLTDLSANYQFNDPQRNTFTSYNNIMYFNMDGFIGQFIMTGPSSVMTYPWITLPLWTKYSCITIDPTGTYLFILGGANSDASIVYNNLQKYNLIGTTWESDHPTGMGQNRHRFSCHAMSNGLYAIGGIPHNNYETTTDWSNTIEKLDISNLSTMNSKSFNILTGQTIQSNIGWFRSVSLYHFIYIIGGYTNTGPNYNGYYNDNVYILNTQTDQLSNGPNLPVAMASTSVAVLNNRIYVISGQYQSGPQHIAYRYFYESNDLSSSSPTITPTVTPSKSPSSSPSQTPSNVPSLVPSIPPSTSPSGSPSDSPSATPSAIPSIPPTKTPTNDPSGTPTRLPSIPPTITPTMSPTRYRLPWEMNATFSNSFLEIYVNIRNNDNDINEIDILPLIFNDCNLFFDGITNNLIGDDAICLWNTNNNNYEILIQLKTNAIVNMSNSLTINRNVFQYFIYSNLYNPSNIWLNNNETLTTSLIKKSLNPLTPIIHIIYPNIIGICDNLTLTAYVDNTGGRPPIFDWDITIGNTTRNNNISTGVITVTHISVGSTVVGNLTGTFTYSFPEVSTNKPNLKIQ